MWSGPRRGAVAVKVAIVLPVLIGFLGLVIDSALLMAQQRAAQNAADAAALAAAMRMLRGANQSYGVTAAAVQDANTFLRTYNLPEAEELVLTKNIHIPPKTGPYESDPSFVEVVVTAPYRTLFMQVLGGDRDRTVSGRAVAGFEFVTSGEGCIVLDPTARPGLAVSGGGTLRILGRVLCNSEGGGVDELGEPLLDASGKTIQGLAASGGQVKEGKGIYAEDLQIVGGVDFPDSFRSIDPSATSSPLHCRQVPAPDPFAHLATPSTANGVVDTYWGSAKISTGTVVLQPGIYDSIEISGGTVELQPGIYVILGSNNGAGLKISQGSLVGEGVMFYLTGQYKDEPTYDPQTGLPDSMDPPDPFGQSQPRAITGQDRFGEVEINSSVRLTPIDTDVHKYDGMTGIDVFNGMLFYQRRKNPNTAKIVGNASDGALTGTIYAKWGQFDLAGQGTYDAQFVVGSMKVTGQGNVTLEYDGEDIGRAPAVFLVE